MHFAQGTSFQASLHPWMPTYEIPGDVTGIGNKCEHSRWMCPCTGTSTPGVHRVPARRAAHVAPSPALLPRLCHWALAGYHLRWSGHHSRRYVLFKGLHKSWQRSMPENLDRRISNLADRTCRFVPVAWIHTIPWIQQQTSLCFQRVWQLPTLPITEGKPVLCGVGDTWHFCC